LPFIFNIKTGNTVILESLRLNVAKMLLRRKVAKMKRQKILYDFASAKYVGVLCVPQNEVNTANIKKFLQYLSQKGIKYSVIGYFDERKVPENFLYLKGIDFITQQDLNLLFMPKENVIGKFIAEPFDMLINCNLVDYFPIEYIASLSVAKCKVGIKRDGQSCYDLMIDISKNKTFEYFLKNLEIYLSNLRNSQIIQTTK
jgi:hypothetical protein